MLTAEEVRRIYGFTADFLRKHPDLAPLNVGHRTKLYSVERLERFIGAASVPGDEQPISVPPTVHGRRVLTAEQVQGVYRFTKTYLEGTSALAALPGPHRTKLYAINVIERFIAEQLTREEERKSSLRRVA